MATGTRSTVRACCALKSMAVRNSSPNTANGLTMPISAYFGGHGREVMAEMKKKHGDKAGEREFYATANAKNQKRRAAALRYTGYNA